MAAVLRVPSEIRKLKAGESVSELGLDRRDVKISPDIVDLRRNVVQGCLRIIYFVTQTSSTYAFPIIVPTLRPSVGNPNLSI
jgi:hypothetical protein